ncbi:MAG: hypothetical protein AAF915_02310 [Cyanobacteria bacterium P01_D01_bin.50]
MNKAIPLGLLAASIALLPMICNKKVLGKSELIVQQNNGDNVSDSPGFGYIETRNGRISMNVDKTYSIYSKDGKVLAEDITLEELEAKNPALHDIVKDSIAKPTLMMDAGIGIDR